ncbi:hypothetical protein [Argonema galeatum]|uniref:hypothetical protein n=1 Tax=Argonema galeatum TaxID=2942762 RepID=UPI00201384D7|nr:hypothetical protein [Argonema galeatum]MCL1465594.1 hypothetical protein [Argonema galeatum A003/A1]
MLKITIWDRQELYAVYDVVYDSLAVRDSMVKEYFWCSPFADIKSALTEAEDLKICHQYDDSQ